MTIMIPVWVLYTLAGLLGTCVLALAAFGVYMLVLIANWRGL